MMDIQLDTAKSILFVKVDSGFTSENFTQLSNTIDPYLKEKGTLKGVVIETKDFPGWTNVNAFIDHIKFVKNHQAHIQKIAVVTDSKLVAYIRKGVGFFVKPQIKHFPYEQATMATQWIEE